MFFLFTLRWFSRIIWLGWRALLRPLRRQGKEVPGLYPRQRQRPAWPGRRGEGSIEHSADAPPRPFGRVTQTVKYAGDRKTKRLRPKDEAQMAAHLFLLKRKTPNQEEI